MQADLEAFSEELPRRIVRAAAYTPEYRQRSPITCFYASLIAARQALGARMLPSEELIAARAFSEGLLGQHGAETFTEFQQDQAAFVDRMLGLEIRFIDLHSHADEGVEALTHGLKDEAKAVVFGTYHHWVVLDGFKRARNTAWIGMDPANGRRMEDSTGGLAPAYIATRLAAGHMPMVVIENPRKPKDRFRPATPRSERFKPATPKTARFRPANPK